MSKEDKPVDEHSGIETTGHSWDGISELNNPLPRWWLIVWYISIGIAVIYMILMPAIPALPGLGTNTPGIRNASDRDNVAVAMAELNVERSVSSNALLGASLEEIQTDRDLQQFALAMGESLFGDNCATCHGAGGRGAKGYPVLADDVWLWDGTLDGIETTLRHGIRHEGDDATRFSAMPRFGRDKLLTSQQIDDLTEYVLNFSGRSDDTEAVNRAAPLWSVQCSSCHGENGMGDRTLGAPNLTDTDWLYGGQRDDIYSTIYNARNSHMPAWGDRLDDASIKALAVYVHSLGGGE
ncbi:cytochrome-c oxidase, cbb3-type subunit III [Hyphomonas johnsonii]|uniref:Cbb3-type cytochrome c oxidase subunit n=1 Tax=Hyphomonas johnsonii MHS-2 TaxID=1280950 RepID=A0A059FSA0_9PROT|nr:cytochrome-c oxidase, cbb3-type subunit III [Hyphomonas johnsonii]KCZ93401.1 cbb3-type cytochrome c oxidase subunit III [Hyphomonas johnsonii MHS-2]